MLADAHISSLGYLWDKATAGYAFRFNEKSHKQHENRSIYTKLTNICTTSSPADSLRASSHIWASETSLARTRERAARASGSSERRSREARFACPNRRACSQATPRIHRCAGILEMPGSQAHRERLRVTAPSVNRFRLEKQQLWKCITLFRRFLNRHCTTTTGEVSNFQVYGERKHKATIFFFLFWT